MEKQLKTHRVLILAEMPNTEEIDKTLKLAAKGKRHKQNKQKREVISSGVD